MMMNMKRSASSTAVPMGPVKTTSLVREDSFSSSSTALMPKDPKDTTANNSDKHNLTPSKAMPVSLRKSILTCLFYACTSISITFFNKAVFSVYHFKYPCILTLLQISFCICALHFAHISGALVLPPLRMKTAKQVFPLALCWWTYVVSGIVALRYLNIPMFSTLRKFTVLFVLLGEVMILRKPSKPTIWLAVSVMLCGGLLAGMTDLTMSVPGYLCVALCCVATALYLVMIVRVTSTTKLSTFGLLFYNNVLSLPLMVVFLYLFTDELTEVRQFPDLYDPAFLGFLILSAAQATLLNIAIFLCTKINSPLATTVTGQMKDLITVTAGLFVFGDVKLNGPNLAGLAISLIGSLLYSLVKLRANLRSKK